MIPGFLSLPQSLFLAFVITLVSIKLLKPLAPKYGLIDVKDHRKNHDGEIPTIGGIAMYLGVLISAFFLLPNTWLYMTWLFASTGVVILGAWDDAKGLSIKFRLIVQIMMTFVLSIGSGYYLTDLGNLIGTGNIELGLLGYLVTPLAIIGAINAYNMIDGIDGLAGMLALVSFGALAILFWNSSNTYGLYISSILCIVILPYLANNLMFPPFKHKIFMGDAGSMLIGFSVIWLLIYGSQSSAHINGISFTPVTALYIIAIPLMDMVAIMARRIRKGQSPLIADRGHLHHVFMRAGFSSNATLRIITGMAVILALIGVAGNILGVPDYIMFVFFLLVFIIYNYLIKHAWKLSKLLKKVG